MIILAGGLVLLVVNHDAGTVAGLDSDAFAGLIQLGAIALLVGSGIVYSRTAWGSGLKMAAGWLAVLLVLVGGYQYRYEIQDVAHRVTAGLVPGSPLSMSFGEDGAAVRLDMLANGHFGARAVVDGVPVDFIVDTGATSTVLSAEDARRVGIDPQALDYAIPISTANGVARAARATVDEIGVGPIVRRRLPVLVAAPGALGQSLLGMNFIGSLSGFDMRRDVMILRD
ncbi:TIGR02281 family clan AA aspartic protease [Aquibium microcysteis]|uniref:TIGR02281 family clan AA aspartic protease n=1 Tax=Aquibium microcysteis TaxID=675281 RepID=UPI00165CF7DC|nr:TIGR02281 family clan AA aspartic protease [Aquibium microcysteis]